MLALDVEVAVVTNVELDHHATYGSLDELREVFREFLSAAAQAVIWDRPELLALRGGARWSPTRRASAELAAGGSRFDWRGHEVDARGARAAQRAQRRRRAGGRRRSPASSRRPAAVARSRASRGAGRRFERLGHTRRRRASSSTTTPTTRRRSRRRSRPRARSAPRRVVAAFQPHLYSRTQHLAREFGARARGGRPGRACSTSTRRASAPRTSRRQRPARRRAVADAAAGPRGAVAAGVRRRRARAARAAARGRRAAGARRGRRPRARRAPRRRGAPERHARNVAVPAKGGWMSAHPAASAHAPPARDPPAPRAAGAQRRRSLLAAVALLGRGLDLAARLVARARWTRVTSAGCPDRRARPVRAALEAAAADMTTLNVDAGGAARRRRPLPARARRRRRRPTSRTACGSASSSACPVGAIESDGGDRRRRRRRHDPARPAGRGPAAHRLAHQPRRRARQRTPTAVKVALLAAAPRRLRARIDARDARPAGADRGARRRARGCASATDRRLEAKWIAATARPARPGRPRRPPTSTCACPSAPPPAA